jgi:hypothetical protein
MARRPLTSALVFASNEHACAAKKEGRGHIGHALLSFGSAKQTGRPKAACLLVLRILGAGEMNRTPDLLITNELLYRLSYTGFP